MEYMQRLLDKSERSLKVSFVSKRLQMTFCGLSAIIDFSQY